MPTKITMVMKPSRSRWQFRLRTLLLVQGLLCAALAALGSLDDLNLLILGAKDQHQRRAKRAAYEQGFLDGVLAAVETGGYGGCGVVYNSASPYELGYMHGHDVVRLDPPEVGRARRSERVRKAIAALAADTDFTFIPPEFEVPGMPSRRNELKQRAIRLLRE